MLLSSIAPHIWFDDRLVPQEEAKIHVLTVAAKYAATVFEGICAYEDPLRGELNIFRLHEHLVRFKHSMKIMRFDQDWSAERLTGVVLQTLRANKVKVDSHIRVSAMVVGQGLPHETGPTALMCGVVRRGRQTLEERAVHACVSAWRRIDDESMPPRVKCAANYNNGRLGLVDAHAKGFDEAIFLTQRGKVAEGSGACVFVVRDGQPITSRVTDGILESITRQTLLELFEHELDVRPIEREIDRTELYIADEIFMCGSGYEITPVLSVDRLPVGDGRTGPLTTAVWEKYEALVRGQLKARRQWLTAVYC